MSMKKDLTGESIHLVNDATPEKDKIPEDMIEDDGVVVPYDPDQKVVRLVGEGDPITPEELGIGTNVPTEIGTHISLENMKHNFRSPFSRKRFMDHGLMYDPTRSPRYPSSRDWNMPDIKCSRRTCVANYSGKCTMPSLIEIGAKGCKGYRKRQSGRKK